MYSNFQSILADHGFSNSKSQDLTIIGWSYDIEFACFDSQSPFDFQRSQIIRCWDNPEAYIHAILIPVDGDIAGATRFLIERIYSELRYSSPVLELITVHSNSTQSVLRMLTVSAVNAMTLKFTIQKGE